MSDVLGQKLGPLPLVVWAGLAAAAAAIGLAIRGKMGSSSAGAQSSSIDMLAPSAAEAFGTLEQQQQDLSNALASLGSTVGTSQSGTETALAALADQLGTTQTALATAIANAQGAITGQVVQTGQDVTAANRGAVGSAATGLLDQMQANQALEMSNWTYQFAGPNDPRIAQWQQAAGTYQAQSRAALQSLSTG